MIRFLFSSPLGFRHLLVGCAVIVLIHSLLLQVMARTGIVEKVMAFTCSWWELLLILGFLVSRVLSYLLVPPLLLALGVYALLSGKPSGDDWSEAYRERRAEGRKGDGQPRGI